MQHRTITIIGGGPIGLTMALLLGRQGISVTIFDIGNSKLNDGRILALSYASYRLLDELESWPQDLATKINQVHISHNGFGVSNILASDVNLAELGFTISYADICALLKNKVLEFTHCEFIKANVSEVNSKNECTTITYLAAGKLEYMSTDLVIMAEGGKVKIENIEYDDYDYLQSAIIAKLRTQKKCAGIAYEHFDKNGPLVLLPYKEEYVLVWSLTKQLAEELTVDSMLNEKLRKMPFMGRFGAINVEGTIHSFPLKRQIAKHKALNNIVLIGNSAQIVHPVSAQGMNLGLRDALALSEIIAHSGVDINALKTYEDLRKNDSAWVTNFTHILARFLDKNAPMLNYARGLGIMGLNNCKIVQNKIAKSLIFGH